MGIVSEYVGNLIAKQVDDNGLVVWYDPDGAYADAVAALDLPDTSVLRYEGSFVRLRWEIDQKKLMDGEEPPRLVVYVPLAQDQTDHALIELEAAGVIMQPGQQPPARNTRLAVVARNALAEKGGEISKGVIALMFDTGNPQEVALSFLDSDRLDESITKKDAKGELGELLRRDFSFDVPDGTELDDLRQPKSS